MTFLQYRYYGSFWFKSLNYNLKVVSPLLIKASPKKDTCNSQLAFALKTQFLLIVLYVEKMEDDDDVFILVFLMYLQGICNKMNITFFSNLVLLSEYFDTYYTLNVRSRGKQLVLFSWESWCFRRGSQGKHQDSRENKTNWFPEGPDIKCFVIFLDLPFNSNKRITAANQNSQLGTYNNTNLILKTTQWMIYKVLSSYYLHLFPPLAAVFVLGIFGIT